VDLRVEREDDLSVPGCLGAKSSPKMAGASTETAPSIVDSTRMRTRNSSAAPMRVLASPNSSELCRRVQVPTTTWRALERFLSETYIALTLTVTHAESRSSLRSRFRSAEPSRP